MKRKQKKKYDEEEVVEKKKRKKRSDFDGRYGSSDRRILKIKKIWKRTHIYIQKILHECMYNINNGKEERR